MSIHGSGSFEPMRREPRMKVLLAAELRTETRRISCRVIDLSRSGACLELDRPVALASQLALHRGSMEAKGQVVWLNGRRCGIRFEQPIRATDLLVQMSESRNSEGPSRAAPIAAAMSRSPSR